MLEEHFKDDREVDFQTEIEETQRKIAVLDKKFDNLVDMRMAGEIDKAKFEEKKKSLFDDKAKLEKVLESYQGRYIRLLLFLSIDFSLHTVR